MNTHDELAHFWGKVRKTDSCWLWLGAPSKKPVGYGRFHWNRRTERAHRASWRFHRGPIPADKLVLHKCNMSMCIRPSHLYLGVQADNILDELKSGTRPKGKDHWRAIKPERGAVGERVSTAKLKTQDVRKIRKLGATGVSQRKLAHLFNVSQVNVGQILRRKTWRHVA